MSSVVHVHLPAHLRNLAKLDGDVSIEVTGDVTQRAVLDALEAAHPVLLGTIRDRATAQRRSFVRFFACKEDISHDDPDTPLPERVVSGEEPFVVIGAMAGG